MRQFVQIDELTRAHRQETDDLVSQTIKKLTTSKTLVVNRKRDPEYTIENHANIVITSNYADCIQLDADDRRATVLKWTGKLDRRGDQPYWQKYVAWLESDEGPAALFDWLLRQDLRRFDPGAWALETEAKNVVKDLSRSPMESWCLDLLHNPESTLPSQQIGRCLWTAKELSSLYYGEHASDIRPGKVRGMSVTLRNVGFNQANGGRQLRHGVGAPDRFWVIQKRDRKWEQDDCILHLKKFPAGV
jgi:hypothetical protein